MGRPAVEMVGQVYGELTVLRRAPNSPGDSSAVWVCLCTCGKEKAIRRSALIAKVGNRTVSCGHVRDGGLVGFKHGGSKTRLYHCWQGMKDRTNNANSSRHVRWGGRGIKIEQIEWYDFAIFREWALANGYADHLTLERRDNNKGYSPENCYWATGVQQANNTRRNVLLTAFGETKNVRAWSRDMRCWASEAAIRSRIKLGWPSNEIITRPTKSRIDGYRATAA